jgi:hypothetical protein
VGWKRARKICEKHWRRSENNCWERDGTSAVIAVPSLTALSTTASRQSARRIADPSRSDTRNVGFGFSAEQSTTNPPDLALRPRPTGARLSTPFQPCVQADVRHAAASIPRAPSHQTRQISGGEPCGIGHLRRNCRGVLRDHFFLAADRAREHCSIVSRAALNSQRPRISCSRIFGSGSVPR